MFIRTGHNALPRLRRSVENNSDRMVVLRKAIYLLEKWVANHLKYSAYFERHDAFFNMHY